MSRGFIHMLCVLMRMIRGGKYFHGVTRGLALYNVMRYR